MDRCSDQAQAITRALGALTETLANGPRRNWQFVPENGAKVDVRARLVDPWFELTASAPTTPLPLSRAWSLLHHNAVLSGAVRMALAPDAGEAHVRGEICMEDDGPTDLDTRIRTLCDDAQAAFHGLHDCAQLGRTDPDADPPAVADTAAADRPRDGHRLVQFCTEAGWPFVERAAGRVEVCIECGPVVYQAQLELTPDGALCAVADLVDASALTSTTRAATALLLLNTSALVRSVKAVAVRRDGVDRAGLAAACERPRSGADLDRALSALTVACSLAGREAQALRHEPLAREYLAWHVPAVRDDTRETFDHDQSNHNQSDNDQRDDTNHDVMEETPCLQQL
jgi:hypothetical protein